MFERQSLSDRHEILSSIIIVSQTQLRDQTQNVQSLNKKKKTLADVIAQKLMLIELVLFQLEYFCRKST